MRNVLAQSLAQQRRTLTIVGHSFELLNRARTGCNGLIVRRFLKLCELLADAKPRAFTKLASEFGAADLLSQSAGAKPILSTPLRTGARVFAQVYGNAWYR